MLLIFSFEAESRSAGEPRESCHWLAISEFVKRHEIVRRVSRKPGLEEGQRARWLVLEAGRLVDRAELLVGRTEEAQAYHHALQDDRLLVEWAVVRSSVPRLVSRQSR
ncbi:MAG: hypothetical protein AB8B50_11965 [Pirellulaceae bacterium]